MATTNYNLPTVSNTDKIDGATQLTALAEATDNALDTIASSIPAAYTLPAATSSTLGGVKVGTGLAIDAGGVLSTAGGDYTLPVASSSQLGGVKIGTGLIVGTDGTISLDANYIKGLFTTGATWGDIANHGFTYK